MGRYTEEEEAARKVYKVMDRIPTCGTEQGDSLYLTFPCVKKIHDIFGLDSAEFAHVLWIGCGDAREALALLTMHPNVLITAIDVEQNCIDGAREGLNRVIKEQLLAPADRMRIHLVNMDAVDLSVVQKHPFTHVYSFAVSGPKVYKHILQIAIHTETVTSCILYKDPAWDYFGIKDGFTDEKKMTLSGSRRMRRACALPMNTEIRQWLLSS